MEENEKIIIKILLKKEHKTILQIVIHFLMQIEQTQLFKILRQNNFKTNYLQNVSTRTIIFFIIIITIILIEQQEIITTMSESMK